MDNSEENWVVLKEDKKEVIQELTPLLSDCGISTRMALAPGCGAGKCSSKFLLLVSEDDAPAAHASIEEFYMKKYPEIKTSQDWESEGRCPACGHQNGIHAKECQDCGLLLIIER